jgi:hypothetical protein
MLTEYSINPAFNKDLIFAYRPSPEIDLSKLPNLPENWQVVLQTIICEADPKLPKDILSRHLEKTSIFSEKNQLIKKLQLILHRLLGNLDTVLGKLSIDERQGLLTKLAEEIIYCTEGLYNRVSMIVDLFYPPRNLEELIYTVIKSRVEEVAHTLTDEVHAWNRVSIIAASDGLGIKANFPEDRYTGALIDTTIRNFLKHSFHEIKFTPFHLPTLLINEFIRFIPELEAEKNKENGLTQLFQEKIITLIQRFLPEYINTLDSHHRNYWLNYFEVFHDKKDYQKIKLVTLNWEKLYQSFFAALSQYHYFENPKKNTLIDCAYYNLFLTKKPNDSTSQLISFFFKEEKHSDLLEQLVDLKVRFPKYYQKISKINVFNKKGLVLINYLTRQLKIHQQHLPKIILGLHLCINLHLKNRSYLIDKIAKALLLKSQSGSNLLMFASQNNLELTKDILSFIKENKKFIDNELIKKFFLMKNKENLNALMLATMYYPELLTPMLKFIGENISLFGDNLQDIFLEKNHPNILMLAANKTEAVDAIMSFFNRYIYSLTKKIFFKLFTQKQTDSETTLSLTIRQNPTSLNNILVLIVNYLNTDGITLNENDAHTLLMIAAKSDTEATSSILQFISKNIRKFDPKVLKKIFLEKDQNGFTILMLAAQYQPCALKIILDFINSNHTLFHKKDLPDLFLEKNPENYNCLMLATASQPLSVPIILNFIYNQFNFFQDDLLEILFAKNKKGFNSLMLASHHIDTFILIINFINKLLENKRISITLEEIFLQKHTSGFTLLMYTTRDSPKSLNFLLKFIEEHSNQFSTQILYQLITEKNELEYNALMLAARNQPAALLTLLNFIQIESQHFSEQVIQDLFLHQTSEGMNILMIAVQYQPESVKLILNFIQKKSNFFTPTILNRMLIAHDQYGVNALMLAATYQTSVVELLLSFLTKNIQDISIDTLQELVFKNIHDKKAANAVFFGGGYNFRKTVLSETNQLEDRAAVNTLLKFIDRHIELLGINTFIKLITEQDQEKNYIFNPACAQYPDIMKNVLNFIATLPDYEALRPIQSLVTDFIFDQLVRWTVKKEDESLFYKIIFNCSSLLLNKFSPDYFDNYPTNLYTIARILLCSLSSELECKKIKIQNQYFFFRWISSIDQEIQVAEELEKIISKKASHKLIDLIELGSKHSKLLKSPSILSHLYNAFLTVEEFKAEEAEKIIFTDDAQNLIAINPIQISMMCQQ